MISQCRWISSHRAVHLKHVQFFICKLHLHKTVNKTQWKQTFDVSGLIAFILAVDPPPGCPPAPVPPERILCFCPSNTDLGAIPTPDNSFAFPRKSHREVGADSSPSTSLSFPLWGNHLTSKLWRSLDHSRRTITCYFSKLTKIWSKPLFNLLVQINLSCVLSPYFLTWTKFQKVLCSPFKEAFFVLHHQVSHRKTLPHLLPLRLAVSELSLVTGIHCYFPHIIALCSVASDFLASLVEGVSGTHWTAVTITSLRGHLPPCPLLCTRLVCQPPSFIIENSIPLLFPTPTIATQFLPVNPGFQKHGLESSSSCLDTSTFGLMTRNH